LPWCSFSDANVSSAFLSCSTALFIKSPYIKKPPEGGLD
jgi:hypothetical protein